MLFTIGWNEIRLFVIWQYHFDHELITAVIVVSNSGSFAFEAFLRSQVTNLFEVFVLISKLFATGFIYGRIHVAI